MNSSQSLEAFSHAFSFAHTPPLPTLPLRCCHSLWLLTSTGSPSPNVCIFLILTRVDGCTVAASLFARSLHSFPLFCFVFPHSGTTDSHSMFQLIAFLSCSYIVDADAAQRAFVQVLSRCNRIRRVDVHTRVCAHAAAPLSSPPPRLTTPLAPTKTSSPSRFF